MRRFTLPCSTFLFLTLVATIEAKEKAAPTQPPSASPIGKLDPEMAEQEKADDGLSWHDATTWGVEGRILPDLQRKRWFDRLPSSAEGKVTEAVWNLSRHSDRHDGPL